MNLETFWNNFRKKNSNEFSKNYERILEILRNNFLKNLEKVTEKFGINTRTILNNFRQFLKQIYKNLKQFYNNFETVS